MVGVGVDMEEDMTDKLNALDTLIEAVEAGDEYIERDIQNAFGGYRESYNSSRINRAYNGSLDAALALHEALLPGWVARVTTGSASAGVKYSHCTVEDWDDGTEVDANNQPTPARAWLLAILRAYRSVQA